MQASGFASSMIQSLATFWQKLVEPSPKLDEENRPLSRVLNGVLLILVVVGGIAQIEYIARRNQIDLADIIIFFVLILFVVAYGLNRIGHFTSARTLVFSAFIAWTFASVLLNQGSIQSVPVLFYLIVPILMGEFFLSLRGYLVTAGVILTGILSLVYIGLDVIDLFSFFLIFSTLTGIASFHRRRIQRERQASLRVNEER